MEEIFRNWVLAVIVNEKWEVLMGLSPKHGWYKFPQWWIDKKESAREGVKRELKEELNLELHDEDILEEYEEKPYYYYPKELNFQNWFVGQKFTVFKIKYNDTMNIVPQDDEFENMVRIDPKKFDSLDTIYRKQAYQEALKLCWLF